MAGKTRVHELAKELGVAPKLIIDELDAMGYKERTSSSALDDALLAELRGTIAEKAAEFAQREQGRLEATRAAAMRARLETAKAAVAKAARARTRKTDATKPRTERAKSTRAKAAPKVAPTPAAVKPKAPEKPRTKPEETVEVPAAQRVDKPAAVVASPPAAAPPPAVKPVAPVPSPPPPPAPRKVERREVPAAPAAPPEEIKGPKVIRRAVIEPAARVEAPPEPKAPPAAAAKPAVTEPEVAPPTKERVIPFPAPPREVAAPPAPAAEAPAPAAPAAAAAVEPQVPAAAPPGVRAEPAAVVETPAPAVTVKRELLRLPESLTVAGLAEHVRRKPPEIIRELLGLGVMATINQLLDVDKAKAVAERFGFDVEVRPLGGAEALDEEVDPSQLRPRPPVVTVMGHVDHGKTSLLDAIRQTKVTEREFGGITQHIGAYQAETSHGKVTFLDTPGHEAFTAMRARGAEATDIVILVVSADDGVMPQTVEAINHARAAGVPIIVAINKIDRPDANPDRVKQELANHGLVVEEWGGQTIAVETSAKKRTGVDQLLEMTALQAEIMELRANPNRAARGVVVEAKLDRGRGPVATVLVQQGTLREGDIFVAGHHSGKVRAMFDDRRQRVKEAGPVDPVELLGLSGVPAAGDSFVVVEEERKARQIVLARLERDRKAAVTVRITLADLHKQIETGEVKELRVIIKGDVHGSLEALQDALERLSTDEVKVRAIHGAVGTITETDVMLASASNAIIIGFNVKPEPKALQHADSEGVEVKSYNVIYEVINDVKAALEGMLAPLIRQILLGKAQVRQLFTIKNIGTIAGSFVSEGKVTRSAKVRVLRGSQLVGDGQISSLKRFKDDVREVLQGTDCGIGIDGVSDVRAGDVLEVYTTEEVARTL
jgi:translation initiation factor IF-2